MTQNSNFQKHYFRHLKINFHSLIDGFPRGFCIMRVDSGGSFSIHSAIVYSRTFFFSLCDIESGAFRRPILWRCNVGCCYFCSVVWVTKGLSDINWIWHILRESIQHGLVRQMTKEELFEELLTKRSAVDTSDSINNKDSVWHETGGLDVEQLKIGNYFLNKVDFRKDMVLKQENLLKIVSSGIVRVKYDPVYLLYIYSDWSKKFTPMYVM